FQFLLAVTSTPYVMLGWTHRVKSSGKLFRRLITATLPLHGSANITRSKQRIYSRCLQNDGNNLKNGKTVLIRWFIGTLAPIVPAPHLGSIQASFLLKLL